MLPFVSNLNSPDFMTLEIRLQTKKQRALSTRQQRRRKKQFVRNHQKANPLGTTPQGAAVLFFKIIDDKFLQKLITVQPTDQRAGIVVIGDISRVF